jgi:hypothetical protein
MRDQQVLCSEQMKDIINDRSKLETIAQKSYVHDNGFVKIVINETLGKKVRLHVFPEDDKIRAAENWHNHRWNFESKILVGSIRHETAGFECVEAGPFVKWHYQRMSNGKFTLLPTTENYRITNHSSEVYITGEKYVLRTGMIHRIIPSGEFTATLVTTEPPNSDSCFQWAEVGHDVGQNGVEQQKIPLVWWEVRSYLKDVLFRMSCREMMQ